MNPGSDIRGRAFLVTGGTGLIGRPLVAELCRLGARRVVVVARHASSAMSGGGIVSFISADITDRVAVESAVEGADVIFHLAAEKRLDVCEQVPEAAVRTNIFGTMLVLDAMRHADSATRIIVASSTKAVHPVSTYGLTKATVERLITADRGEQASRCVAVRLAAVPGDGVLHSWRRSAADDGYIDVTDPEMTRFAMTRSDAVSSLLRAVAIDEDACILAPPTRSYRLGDLAQIFADARGCRIRVVGSRPGESLHEYLVGEYEASYAEQLDNGDYLITPRRRRGGSWPVLSAEADRINVDDLATMFQMRDPVDA